MKSSLKLRAALLAAVTMLCGSAPLYADQYTPAANAQYNNCIDMCAKELKRCKYYSDEQLKTDLFKYNSDVESYDRCTSTRSKKDAYKECRLPRHVAIGVDNCSSQLETCNGYCATARRGPYSESNQ